MTQIVNNFYIDYDDCKIQNDDTKLEYRMGRVLCTCDTGRKN